MGPELEVPIRQPARGVIDLVLTDRASPVVVAAEVQSEMRRLEQQIRWSTEKADGLSQRLVSEANGAPVLVSRLLILRSTATTRELARRYGATFAAAYPARTVDVVRALTLPGVPWPGAGIVWMRIERNDVSILRGPHEAWISVGKSRVAMSPLSRHQGIERPRKWPPGSKPCLRVDET